MIQLIQGFFRYLDGVLRKQFLAVEGVVSVMEQRGFYEQRDRNKGREGYAIKRTFERKFRNISWSNILAISFSFLSVKETLKYRKLSKVFNKAVKDNCRVLINVPEGEDMRPDVKKLHANIINIYKK